MELKYVVTQYSFAIFGKWETHKKVAGALEGKPLGAGFCRIGIGTVIDDDMGRAIINVRCYGESVSLGIKSRPEDEEYINRKIKSHD